MRFILCQGEKIGYVNIKKILFLLIIFAVASSLQPSALSLVYAADKGAAPVAHWRFDEGGGTTAYDSSGGNNGTLVNHTKFVSGKFGKALQFDGTDDYVAISNGSGLFSGKSAVTVSFWIKHNDSNPLKSIINIPTGNGAIFTIENNSAASPALIYFNNNNPASVALTTGEWTHITGVFDNGVVRGYQNGLLVSTTTNTSNVIGTTTGNLEFGRMTWTGGFTNMNLDDARIYNYVRTADQIMMDYNAGSAVRLAAGVDPNEGNPPIGYWNFDENTGTTAIDRSGNGNNGTITNAIWSPGKYGEALDCDGSGDYVSIADSNSLDLTNSLTISGWIYPTALQANGTILTKSAWAYYTELHSDGKLLVYLTGTTSPGYHSSNSAIPMNAWTHFSWTYDGANVKIYINGQLDRTIADTGNISVTTGGVRIGSLNGLASGYEFKGKIDEINIYNYARTPAQVAYDYNKGKPVAQYRFEEGGGAIAHNEYSKADAGAVPVGWWRMDNNWADSSGNGLNGTAGGSATFSSSSKIGPYAGSFNSTTSDYVSITNPSTSQTFTSSFWFRTSTPAADMYFLDRGGNKHWFELYNSKLRSGTSAANYSDSATTIQADTWYHAAMTYDGTIIKQYINGVQQFSIAGGNVTPSGLQLGRYYNGAYYFNGLIDDVRIYNYARTPEQIYNDYKTTHGTLVGDTKFVDGKMGKALQFDGAGDYVDIPNSDSFNASTITVEAWIKRGITGTRHEIISKIQTPGGYELWINSNEIVFSLHDTGGGTHYFSSGGYVGDTNWHHVAATHDGSTIKVYIDGKFINSSTDSFAIGTNSGKLRIGEHSVDGNLGLWGFSGLIDDVRIYNYSRTANQISQDYNAGAATRLGAPSTTSSTPGWRDKNWHYRKSITVTNGGTQELLDYQVQVTVDTAALITAGKMKSNGDDIRFTNQIGNKYLDYWIESGINTSSTKIQVKVDRVNLNPNTTTIYMYYGNPNASAGQNEANTFLFLDDFSTGISNWNITSAVSYDSSTGNPAGSIKSVGTSQNFQHKTFSLTNFILDVNFYIPTGGRDIVNILVRGTNGLTTANGYMFRAQNIGGDGGWFLVSNGSHAKIGSNMPEVTADVWHTMTLKINGSSLSGQVDGGTVYSVTDSTYSSAGTIGQKHDGANTTHWIDNFRIRKYASPEPSSAAPGTEELSPGPVGHWRFDEGTGATAYDDSDNNNDGTITGATWSTSGKFGKCLSFDGTGDYVTIGDPANGVLDFGTGEFTILLWAKSNQLLGGRNYYAKQEGTGWSNGKGIKLYSGNGSFDLSLYWVIGNGTTHVEVYPQGWTKSNDTFGWVQVGIVRDSSNNIYRVLNGVKEDSGQDLAGDVSNAVGLTIGGGGGEGSINGFIDDVRIYNYARTADQIQQDFNAGAAARLGN